MPALPSDSGRRSVGEHRREALHRLCGEDVRELGLVVEVPVERAVREDPAVATMSSTRRRGFPRCTKTSEPAAIKAVIVRPASVAAGVFVACWNSSRRLGSNEIDGGSAPAVPWTIDRRLHTEERAVHRRR